MSAKTVKSQQCTATAGSKLVIIGSGFHRHVLSGLPHPLCDWSRLLQQLANSTGCSLEQDDYSEPTQAWEKLVSQVAARSKSKIQAKDAERELKEALCRLLRESVDGSRAVYDSHPLTGDVAAFLGRGGGHLVSLNFDQLAYAPHAAPSWRVPSRSGKKRKGDFGRKADYASLYRRVMLSNPGAAPSMIWHPHGCLTSPQTLRLGYRDYGFLPAAYHHAFNQFKCWERKILDKRSRRSGSEAYADICRALSELDKNPHDASDRAADTWVTRFMLLPVEVIGAEISTHEVGLRWLFVQRHRNLQQYAPDSVPVIHRKVVACALPWKSRVQEHRTWGEAWSAALMRR